MARPPSGPLGNSPRDMRDDFVGEPADEIKAGTPPRWPPKPKKITKNDFHAKVSGGSSSARADRAPHYRRGGFVSARKDGGELRSESTEMARATNRMTSQPRETDPAKVPAAWEQQKKNVEEFGRVRRETGYKSGGRLTAGERQSLPSSDFALPGKGKGPKGAGAGSYPIPDASHARNALARVSQHGSSAEKSAVRAKVKAKYPGIGQKK